MAASSAMLIVGLSVCDLISAFVVIWVCGLTTDAPRMGLPTFYEPSVYMKSYGFHAAWKGLIEGFMVLWADSEMSGYGSV